MSENKDKFTLRQRSNGSIKAKQNFPMTIDPNTEYTVRITYDGTNYIASVNGTPIITLAPGVPAVQGTVAFEVIKTSGTFGKIEVN
jgi:hypothetical protein